MIGHHGFGFAHKYLPIKSIGIVVIFRLIRQELVNVNTLKLKYKKVHNVSSYGFRNPTKSYILVKI